MGAKPGSAEEAEMNAEWAKRNVNSSVAQVCKEQQEAIRRIDRGDEEHF